jgi:branched-chain amino acid transport system substrate-binding protein
MADLISSCDGEIVGQRYLREEAPFEEFDALIKDMKNRKPDIVFNNFVGHSNVKFYKAYADNGLDAYQMPVASLTTSETDIREIGVGAASGHITAATYFQSQTNLANRSCLERYQAAHGEPPNANMGWEAAYTQAHVVAQAMRRCDSDNVNLVRAQILGTTFDAPQGVITIDPLNSHAHVWPKIGVVRDDGQFEIVAETSHAVSPDPYRTAYFLDDEDGPVQTTDLPKTLRADSFGTQE